MHDMCSAHLRYNVPSYAKGRNYPAGSAYYIVPFLALFFTVTYSNHTITGKDFKVILYNTVRGNTYMSTV